MTELDITLCGHGSGTPSTKVMQAYLNSRYTQYNQYGMHKCVVAVRRLKALTDDKRKLFHDTYKTILGRNLYNQSLRQYVFEKHNGKYYSDCSSSICATFKKIGYDVPLLNTAGIYTSSLFEDVPVKIENGHIKNPDVLKIGDCLMFVGNDKSRPLCIGHVEAVYSTETKMWDVGWHMTQARWWYADTETTYYKSRWADINHHRYYFDKDGYAVTGHQIIDGKEYFFEDTPNAKYECALMRTKDDNTLEYVTV